MSILIPVLLGEDIPERQQHRDGYNKTMERGHPCFSYRCATGAGSGARRTFASIAFSVAMPFSEDKNTMPIVAIIRAEPTQFIAVRQLRTRLTEIEANADRS
ncbi:MAG: hypothetical protein ABI476_01625 [Oxalobacteraceae bacterium]